MDPVVFQSATKGGMAKQGGPEWFLERAEPDFSELPLEKVMKRFPEDEYTFRGCGLGGEQLFGSAFLTPHIPVGPVLISPLEKL
jgi:hypothetical protein